MTFELDPSTRRDDGNSRVLLMVGENPIKASLWKQALSYYLTDIWNVTNCPLDNTLDSVDLGRGLLFISY